MWYAVFSRSLIALLFAAFTLLGYLSLELNQTYLAGPFYFLLPLPFSIIYFWHYCEAKFKAPSMVRRTMNFIDFNFFINYYYCTMFRYYTFRVFGFDSIHALLSTLLSLSFHSRYLQALHPSQLHPLSSLQLCS